MTTTARREMRLKDLDEVVREADRLHTGGYERAGQWDLAQTCQHLAAWLRYPVEGFPRVPWPVKVVLTALRYTVAPREIRRMLETGAMRAGRPTMPETVPAAGGDEAAAVEALRQAATRFRDHAGPYHPSPLFGTLDKDKATRLQLIHCSHHLGYLVPRSVSASPS